MSTQRAIFFIPLILLSLMAPAVFAQLEVVSDGEAPMFFSELPQTLEVKLRNSSRKTVSAEWGGRIYQASSSTLLPVGELSGLKKIQVLPGQTAIEKITVKFPAIKTGTCFHVVFESNQEKIGTSMVRVYPLDALSCLKTLGGGKSFGLVDPHNQLKPLFEAKEMDFDELAPDSHPGKYRGKFIIAGPFRTKKEISPKLDSWIATQTRKGVPVVLLQGLNSDSLDLPQCTVKMGSVPLVFAALPFSWGVETPQFQLGLVRLAEMALTPSFFNHHSPTP